MTVAIATDNGRVSGHFGRCSEYTLADIEGNEVKNRRTLANPGHEPGFLPGYLAERGVNAIVCGGMGPRAQGLFASHGIDVRMGVAGPVDAVLEQFAAGTLAAGASTCDHESRGDGTHRHHCR